MLKDHLYSIFNSKCPRCHKGDFFVDSNPYNLKQAGNIREKCSNCDLKYTPELGFYYGGMYVSYGLGIAMFVTIWVVLTLFYPNYPPLLLISLLFTSLIILGPYIYALSKIIWANMFFSYDKKNAQTEIKSENDTRQTKG